MSKEGVVYLGGPYTHHSPQIRLARFEAITRAAAKIIETGRIVYSPLTMTHPIDLVLASEGETLGSDYWVKFDEAFMAFCSEMIVFRLSGWDQSSGVKREMEYFREKKLPITFVDPQDFDIPDVLSV
jgi:hypothetical protein